MAPELIEKLPIAAAMVATKAMTANRFVSKLKAGVHAR